MRRILYGVFVLLWISILVGGFALRHFLSTLPPTHLMEEYQPQMTTRIFDYKGNMVTELFTERRVWVTLDQIPVHLQNAFISVEDDKFYKHWGLSPAGMMRAAVKNFLAGRVVQGGSTITQQLAKLIFLTQERTMGRKIREQLLALEIEHMFSKPEILQMYLNQVYFGQGAYGVAAAARVFFGKTAQELTLEECALLAGLPRLPNYYSPIAHMDRAVTRRAVVLNRMRDLKYISDKEAQEAKARPINVMKSPAGPVVAPYYIEYLRQYLDEKYGSEQLYRGGLSIYTTLNVEMQGAAERVMDEALDSFDKEYGPQAETIRAKNKQDQMRKSGTVPKNYVVKVSTTVTKVQGALVALDSKTGAVRAMVGGRSFQESQFNRAVQARRQPGSAFKPFVWLAALDNGFTAATIMDDFPVAFQNNGNDWKLIETATDTYAIAKATATLKEDLVWIPKNFDGKYFGPVTLRRALAFSRNIVAVRLIDKVTPKKVVEVAQKLGIRSALDPFLALGLGTSVTTILEMTAAYGGIAAEGIRTEPYTIDKVVDFEGKILEEHKPEQSEAVSPDTNFLVTNLLKAVVSEGTGRAARIVGRPLAGKTGTSQDQRDMWFIGFTPDLVCGAWMGYDDFSPMGRRMASGGILVPWWAKFMKEALKDVPVKDFSVPEGITYAKIDAQTGYRALPTCPKIILEAFKAGTEPKDFCPVDHSAHSLNELETED